MLQILHFPNVASSSFHSFSKWRRQLQERQADVLAVLWLQVLRERGADPSAGLNSRAKASEKTVSSLQDKLHNMGLYNTAALKPPNRNTHQAGVSSIDEY
jgi:hypothetical protein